MTDQQARSGPHTAADTGAVELGTGFRDDEVSVLLDGREVWHGSGVTTNYSVGVAAVVPLPPAAGPEPVVEVRVGARAQATLRLDLAGAIGGVRLRCDLDPAGAIGLGPAPDEPVF